MKKTLSLIVLGILLGSAATFVAIKMLSDAPSPTEMEPPSVLPEVNTIYTCENMQSKADCEGMTPSQCSQKPYVQWAKKNCGFGTPGNEIGL